MVAQAAHDDGVAACPKAARAKAWLACVLIEVRSMLCVVCMSGGEGKRRVSQKAGVNRVERQNLRQHHHTTTGRGRVQRHCLGVAG